MLNKKGAMFGLDARIALAIFGALSVISGAALYSAIQQAKIVSMATDIDEFAKAHNAYYLDVGELISLDVSSTKNDLRPISEEVITSAKTGWKGPYVSYEDKWAVDDGYLSYNKYGADTIHYFYAKDNSWGGGVNPGPTQVCDNADPCYLWVVIHELTPELADALDVYYDGSKDYDAGNVRVVTADSNTNGKYDVVAFKQNPVPFN